MRRFLVCLFLLTFGTIASAKPPKGLWKPLLVKGAKFSLPVVDKSNETAPPNLQVEVTDARKVGAADVVTLQWVWSEEDGEAPTQLLPQQLAVSKKGIYILAADADDKAIAAALKKKPSFTDPAKIVKPYTRKDGLFTFAPKGKKGTMCYGFGAAKVGPDETGCGAAPCTAWMCFDATGLVGAGGDGNNFGLGGEAIPLL